MSPSRSTHRRIGRQLARLAGLAAGLGLAGGAGAEPTSARLMDWPDLMSRPTPAATTRIAYGQEPLQVADLWLPDGKGPFPVVLMVHGGCWRSGVAKLSIMNYIAEDLRRRGVAVWNVEYRGVDRPGGGYPGSFQDVAAAADLLASIGPAHHLKTDRVIALGHSAGGHFVLWLAARSRLPPASPLKAAHPLAIAAVVSLGGLPDLEEVRALGGASCGSQTVDQLVGKPSPDRPDVYADTSPAELGAGRDREVLINGPQDPIAPPAMGAAYAAKMRAKGARIRQITIPDTGHVELIAPGTAAWAKVVETVRALLGGAP
jgi:acetyl esterase/lipase